MIERFIAESTAINTTITTYVVAPLIIFFLGIALSVLLKNMIHSALQAIQLDMRLANTTSISISNTIANTFYVIGWIVSAALALHHINLFGFVMQRIGFFLFWFSLLAGAFALTDGVRNLIKKSAAQKKYPVGSTYKQGVLRGTVKKHTLTHLVIFTNQVERVHVPYLTALRASK